MIKRFKNIDYRLLIVSLIMVISHPCLNFVSNYYPLTIDSKILLSLIINGTALVYILYNYGFKGTDVRKKRLAIFIGIFVISLLTFMFNVNIYEYLYLIMILTSILIILFVYLLSFEKFHPKD
jgi:hypothetical protein